MPSLRARARKRLTKTINYVPLPFYIVFFMTTVTSFSSFIWQTLGEQVSRATSTLSRPRNHFGKQHHEMIIMDLPLALSSRFMANMITDSLYSCESRPSYGLWGYRVKKTLPSKQWSMIQLNGSPWRVITTYIRDAGCRILILQRVSFWEKYPKPRFGYRTLKNCSLGESDSSHSLPVLHLNDLWSN